MSEIRQLKALEILDSRGKPTISVTCILDSGISASVSVPSGASTGKGEALELRDGDSSRYNGLGCLKAVSNVEKEISSALLGRKIASQSQLDELLIALDGTPEKQNLGANALLGVSLAFARASAAQRDIPLYSYFSEFAEKKLETLPRLTINLFSGGKHAGGQVPLQDLLIVPVSSNSIAESLRMTAAVYQSACKLIQERYGMRPLVADEGGLAPPFPTLDAIFEDALESIQRAGFKPGKDVALALDCASSHFYEDGKYHLLTESLDSSEMVGRISGWVSKYPIISIEDGLAEDDWKSWPLLKQTIGGKALVLGDDLLCTDPKRVLRAQKENAADALLLKVNQIGTLTEAVTALHQARKSNWTVTVSARSGETEDNWLADLAVGWQGDQIKIGSIVRSERLAKYNRLLEIERDTGLSNRAFKS